MLLILPGVRSIARDAVKTCAREARYPLTNDPTLAEFFIGMVGDSFPSNTPFEQRIILRNPDTPADIVLSGTHQFSSYTQRGINTSLSLSQFLANRLR